jgi:lysophospholipase L1-like esterase
MTLPPTLSYAIILAAITIVSAGCNLFEKDGSGGSPTAPTPPSPTSPIRYTALGASDAIGVGASVVCVPLTPCDNGTGYVPLLAQRLRAGREVRLTNIGIPAAVLSPAIQQLGQAHGRDIPANIIDREMPFIPTDATLVTILAGPNDVNALGDAIQRGAAGSTDPKTYIETQVRAWGADYDRLIRGAKNRAPQAFIIVLNVPNMAALPYSANYTTVQKQGLQAISVGLTREVNRQAGAGVVVLDLMCDAQTYDRSRYASDGFHPNDAGYAYMADRLLAIVNGATPSPAASCAQMTLVPPL